MNFQLNRLLSFPLKILLLCLIFDKITLGVLLYFWNWHNFNLCYIAFILVNTFYLLLITYLNQQNIQFIAALSEFRRKRKVYCAPCQISMVSPSVTETGIGQQDRFTAVQLYNEYFQLRLFHLIQLDYGFMLKVALFIMHYAILVIQTS